MQRRFLAPTSLSRCFLQSKSALSVHCVRMALWPALTSDIASAKSLPRGALMRCRLPTRHKL